MFRTMMTGWLFALLAGAMGSADAQSMNWPQPRIACTEANAWQTYDVQYFTRYQQLQITYVCDPDYGWTVSMVCDLQPGGICTVD